MMVSNRLSNIPTQIICSDEIDLDSSTVLPETFIEEFPVEKPSVSIVELGRRLRKCARLGNTEQVHELMTKGAPFTTDWLGTSALHLAAMNNHLETCEALLRAGISRDARTKVERTPLHLAAYEGHASICELLLINKAEVDPRDMLKMTPLHWAVEKQHDAVIELLLQHGADPTVVSKFDKTPISIAFENNRMDLAQLLQLAARLLSQQAELANIEESVENAEATLAATQSLDIQLQTQDDANETTDSIPPETLPPECKQELMDDPQPAPVETIIEEDPDINTNHIEEEPNILKNTNTITSPSQISALQLLQAHGITMLPTDEGGLVNNAIQSGRTLVLSEAGKLVLAEGKKSPVKTPLPVIKPQRKQVIIPNSTLKNKKFITLTHDQFMAITKSQGNKPLLKKISAEAFKKATEKTGVKCSVMPLSKSTPVITYSGPKLKRMTLVPSKDHNKPLMKVINPAAVSGLLTAAKSMAPTATSTSVATDDLETVRSQLSDALAQIEELKRLLNEKELENQKLSAQIDQFQSNVNPSGI